MISQFYVPCDDSNLPVICVTWAGFYTNTQVMAEDGWQVKCLYSQFTKKYIIRFYHPARFMTFALKLDNIINLENKIFEIDFMAIGGKRNRGPISQEFINELTVDDVPALLEAAVELQKPVRKKLIQKIELPEAEIINLKREK